MENASAWDLYLKTQEMSRHKAEENLTVPINAIAEELTLDVEHIQLIADSYEAFKRENGSRFKFTRVYIASHAGFTEDAFRYAKSNGMTCFIMDENGRFKIVTFWNVLSSESHHKRAVTA